MDEQQLQTQEDQVDATFTRFKASLTAAYGAGFETIPWAQIIAIVMQVISGCVTPTPASIRKQLKRPLVMARIYRVFQSYGIPSPSWARQMNAFGSVADSSPDADMQVLIDQSAS